MSNVDLHPDELFDAFRSQRLDENGEKRLHDHCAVCEACAAELTWMKQGLHCQPANEEDRARGARAVGAVLALHGIADHPQAKPEPAPQTVDAPITRGMWAKTRKRRPLLLALLIVAASGSSAAALWTGKPLLERIRLFVQAVQMETTSDAMAELEPRPKARSQQRAAAKRTAAAEAPVPELPSPAGTSDVEPDLPTEAPLAATSTPEVSVAVSAAARGPSPATRAVRRRAAVKSRPDLGAAAEELLRSAAQLRSAGAFADAERAYGDVAQRYPSTRSGLTALIARGSLQLHQLNSPQTALSSFTMYLSRVPQGPLSEEALTGLAQAYRRLDRPALEAQTWQKLLSDHPGSLYATAARRRLQDLSEAR